MFRLKLFEVIGSFGGDQNGVYQYEQDDHRWDYQRVSSQVNRRFSPAEFRHVLHPDKDPHGDGVDHDPDARHCQQSCNVTGSVSLETLIEQERRVCMKSRYQ